MPCGGRSALTDPVLGGRVCGAAPRGGRLRLLAGRGSVGGRGAFGKSAAIAGVRRGFGRASGKLRADVAGRPDAARPVRLPRRGKSHTRDGPAAAAGDLAGLAPWIAHGSRQGHRVVRFSARAGRQAISRMAGREGRGPAAARSGQQTQAPRTPGKRAGSVLLVCPHRARESCSPGGRRRSAWVRRRPAEPGLRPAVPRRGPSARGRSGSAAVAAHGNRTRHPGGRRRRPRRSGRRRGRHGRRHRR
jgi:hypothetical protein